MKPVLRALAWAAIALACVRSHAMVIDFDDLPANHNANFGPNFGIVPNGYKGLDWLNVIIEPETAFIPGSLNMNLSLPNIATDANYLGYTLTAAPIQISSATPFEFDTGYFIANQQKNLTITVRGLRDGIIVDTQTLTVGNDHPVLGVFDWMGVDTVTMVGSGGADPTQHQSFTFDNLVIATASGTSAVPELETAALLLAGLGVVASRRPTARSALP